MKYVPVVDIEYIMKYYVPNVYYFHNAFVLRILSKVAQLRGCEMYIVAPVPHYRVVTPGFSAAYDTQLIAFPDSTRISII